MSIIYKNIVGLTESEVRTSRKKYGINSITLIRDDRQWMAFINIVKEPIVIILLVASFLYFISENLTDGLFMLMAIVLIGSISFYQEIRSRKALQDLKKISETQSKVIRDSKVTLINSENLVVGDALVIEEGRIVPADAKLIKSNDFSVNESLITGESIPVYKSQTNNIIYRGSSVVSGMAISRVYAVGGQTKIGQLSKSLSSMKNEKSPLEKQINRFVRQMAIWGSMAFLTVWTTSFINTSNIKESLLSALTMAMSVLPEEIPVAFTTFMAIGSYKLMKLGVVVKDMKMVETLGSTTTICADKTGTITKNEMALAKIYDVESGEITDINKDLSHSAKELIAFAMWASEPIPFDPMEIAIHNKYKNLTLKDQRPLYKMIREYPLSGNPPIMTHILENEEGDRIIAAKGAPEAFIKKSNLDINKTSKINSALKDLGEAGYRVLAVCRSDEKTQTFPKNQIEFRFIILGLVAFYDPPKDNIKSVINDFYNAGIDIKLVTGDNKNTAIAIAKQVGIKNSDKHISGAELISFDDDDLMRSLKENNVFSRVYPEVKVKIVEALKSNGEIVAMTGDGINDGPALKAAHIGIAMGKKGTDIAKEASDLVLVNDDLSHMVSSIGIGRKIYINLKKAVQYIISIHLPIILTVFLPVTFNWFGEAIFYPSHVIILELIMGPTCSIVYENEPVEDYIMSSKPRTLTKTFFNFNEITTSISQGLGITLGVVIIMQYGIIENYSTAVIRSQVFLTLISANVLLTLVNRSFIYSIYSTLRYKNNLIPIIISITILLTISFYILEPLRSFLHFATLNVHQISATITVGSLSVLWYEIVKWRKRKLIA